MKIRTLILSLLAMVATMVAFDSCTKAENENLVSNEVAILSPQERADIILNTSIQYSQSFPDGPKEEAMILTEAEFREICKLEDESVGIWCDDDLRTVLPVGKRNDLPFEEKLMYLKQFIPNALRTAEEGQTIETYQARNSNYNWYDSNPEIIAEVLAATGTIVGPKSSLNMYRPTGDTGAVTYHDVARAFLANIQGGNFDTAIEYDPSSVVFEFQVSGGNWLIGADITYTNPQTLETEVIHYGSDSPYGPLVWNPTLNSPVDDDVIEGPLPNGVYSISANGLVPPAPID